MIPRKPGRATACWMLDVARWLLLIACFGMLGSFFFIQSASIGARCIPSSVLKVSEGAITFYRAMGFLVVAAEEIDLGIGRAEPALIMEFAL